VGGYNESTIHEIGCWTGGKEEKAPRGDDHCGRGKKIRERWLHAAAPHTNPDKFGFPHPLREVDPTDRITRRERSLEKGC